MKSISLVVLCLLLIGYEASKPSRTHNDVYESVSLLEVCADGLVAYKGYDGPPAMYKRTIDDKLVPCDINKFKKD